MIANRFSKIVNIGNSFGLIIPVAVCRDLQILRGQFFNLYVSDENTIVFHRTTVIDSEVLGDSLDLSVPQISYDK